MKRRSFLAMLGLAPAAAALPAVALQPEQTPLVEDINAMIREQQEWLSEGTRALLEEARQVSTSAIGEMDVSRTRRLDLIRFDLPDGSAS